MTPLQKAKRDTRRELVVMMTLQNLTAQVIAARLGVSERTITKDRAAMGVSRPMSTDDIAKRRDAVMRWVEQGFTSPDIAKHLGVTERTIERDREALGIALTPRRWTNEEHLRAVTLIAYGCSLTEVADTIGRSRSSVWHRFKGMGWTPQQCGEYGGMRKLQRRLDV